ncbi:ATP-binding protein [Christensenellaceae bacterium OttesenSCG-928-K19]|nr:ATP-binding protein [Christensenellaceae bacterium OttesenSCG-928-K19]
MKEISLHIMDIVQNSISAHASLIEVAIEISQDEDTLSVSITDNGDGMSEEMVEHVTSPFVTTRTTRRVGLGISLLAAGVQSTGGSFRVDSKLGEGTKVVATYGLTHIDRPPVGDFAGTMHTLIVSNPSIDFVVCFSVNSREEQLDTREVRAVLGEDVPLDTPDVSLWIKENLEELFPAEYMDY